MHEGVRIQKNHTGSGILCRICQYTGILKDAIIEKGGSNPLLEERG